MVFNTKFGEADVSGALGRNFYGTTFGGASAPVLTQDQMNALSQQTFNRVHGTNEGVGAWEHIGRFSTGVLIDFADTVYSSPLNPMDTSRGDVLSQMSLEQQEYYNRNKSAIEATSAVVGGIATVVAAEALIVPKLASAFGSAAALEGTMIMRATKGWNESTRAKLLVAQRAAAESGETFSLMGTAAGRQFMTNRVVAGVGAITRTMPVEYGVMWNNEAFNSGDWATEGFWIGVGAALGGTIGAIGGRAMVRATANSAEIRDLRAAPLSMNGVSNDLLSSESIARADKVHLPDVQLKESSWFTEYALASRSADPSKYDEAAANATRLNSLRGSFFEAMTDSSQKMIAQGIQGVSTVKTAAKNIPEMTNVINRTIEHDPFVMHGVAEIGILPGSYGTAKLERSQHIESLRKQAEIATMRGLEKEAQRLGHEQRVLKMRDDFVLVDGAWIRPESELGEAVINFKPDAVGRLVTESVAHESFRINLPTNKKLRLDAGLVPTDGGGKAVAVGSLSISDRLYLTAAMGQLVDRLAKPNAKTAFKLSAKTKDNWFTLDSAVELIRRGGKIEFDEAVTGIATVGEMERQSLRLKAREVLTEIGELGKITPEMRFKYNLPQATPMEAIEDIGGDGFREWLKTAASEKFTVQELGQALEDMRAIQGVDLRRAEGQPVARVDGNMFGFNRGQGPQGKNQWMRPMLGYFDRESNLQRLSKRAHSEAVTQAKAERTAVLMRANNHVGELTRLLTQRPTLAQAMDIRGLADDMVTGLGGAGKQIAGELLPKKFLARDNKTILAAADLQEFVERSGRAVFESFMESAGMGKIVTEITSAGGAVQRTMLDQYASLRPGWDIEDVAAIGEGKYGFVLKDTESNRYRLGLGKDQKWLKGKLMPNERMNTPIVVDEVALSAIRAYNQITDALISADNTLRASAGLRPVESKKLYMPSAQTKGKHVGFVYGLDDKMIPGRTIVAESEIEYQKLVKRTLDELGNGHTIRTREHLERQRLIYDEAGMDWIDPGISAATAGIGSQRGGLTGAYVKQGAFNEALEWVQRKTQAQAQETLRQLMHESILVARANSAAEKTLKTSGQRNVFDMYEHMLTGQSDSYTKSSIVDSWFRKTETAINGVLANSALTIPARHVMDLAERFGMNPADLNGKKTFESIAKEMGKYTPFKNATEFIESRGVRQPPTVKGMATTLNSIAASVYLRWLELPHAMMNGLGLISAMPAAIMGGRAPISTFVDMKGTKVGIVDGARIMSNSFKRAFSNDARHVADMKHMIKNGDATQSVIEYHQQIGSIQSQAGFMKWLKKADKWASIASEKSESWSRSYAHFVGLELADLHGIKGMEARHNFAREIANSMIADYAPINRPELFGSGFGSMIGLFQSYALNHYTKMFRWMEKGEYAKFGLQAAMQATMFGLPGTYGFGQLMDLRDSYTATGNEPTALDIIYSRFGSTLGGAIAHGGVSELTQIAFWSRGDMTPRIPGASGSLPALDIGRKVVNGFTDGVSSYLNAMPGEGGHAMLEAVQRNMPNRILKSWLILANGGQEIDAYGQVMTDTRTLMDTIARTVGLRSTRQQAELEAFYASKSAIERDSGRIERLRESFRSAVRSNKGDVNAINPIQYFNDYVEAGGNPKGFKTWVKNALRDADSARSVQALKGSVTTPKSALEVWRYGAYGAWAVE